MNIIIFTCHFGSGHNSVAEAIKEKLVVKGYNVQIIDMMDFLFPYCSKTIYKTFNVLTGKYANVYNELSKLNDTTKPPFKMYGIKRLNKLLKESKTDLTISTFPTCSKYISAYKDIYKNDIPLYTFITDIYPQREWILPNTNEYFVGSFTTKDVMLKYGVTPNIINVTGIPVRERFKKKKGSKCKRKNILIMGGGFGIIPVSNEFLSKLDSLEDINIKILTGTNKRLEKNIKNNFKHIEVLGFTPNIQEYMMNADLLITKSGGITIFEAIETETPLCLFEPFLVQEEENAEFIKKHKMGIIVKGEKSKDVKKILDLLNNEEELNEIKRNMQEFKKTLTNPYTKKFYKG